MPALYITQFFLIVNSFYKHLTKNNQFADLCPACNFFFALTLAYHIRHIGQSPRDDVLRTVMIPIQR